MTKKAGRPMRYTAAAFAEAVEHYFRSITRVVPICAGGEVLLNENGEEARETAYLRPPSVSGLCLALGIDRSTWQNYADAEKNPGHAAVCAQARMRIECYLEELLCTKEKSVQGVIFNLQNNYGWRERREVELGAATRAASLTAGMSAAEKVALIREVGGEVSGFGEGAERDEADET